MSNIRRIDAKYHIEVRTTGRPEPNMWEPVIVNTKTGKVLPEDEPLILFRGQDGLVRELLTHYADLCSGAGSPKEQVDLVSETKAKFIRFAADHPERVKAPD